MITYSLYQSYIFAKALYAPMGGSLFYIYIMERKGRNQTYNKNKKENIYDIQIIKLEQRVQMKSLKHCHVNT